MGQGRAPGQPRPTLWMSEHQQELLGLNSAWASMICEQYRLVLRQLKVKLWIHSSSALSIFILVVVKPGRGNTVTVSPHSLARTSVIMADIWMPDTSETGFACELTIMITNGSTDNDWRDDSRFFTPQAEFCGVNLESFYRVSACPLHRFLDY